MAARLTRRAVRSALLASAALVAAALVVLALVRDDPRSSQEVVPKSPSTEPDGAGGPRAGAAGADDTARSIVDAAHAATARHASSDGPATPEPPMDAECGLDLRVLVRGTGEGVEGARVEARPAARPDEAPVAAAGTTDARGRVALALPAGASRVRCWNETFQGAKTFDLAPGERRSAVVEVDPTVVVLGRVLSASGHAPIAGAGVWVDRLGRGATATTDSSGTFEVPFLPASGHPQTLHVRAPGHCKDSVRITASPDGSWTSQLAWLVAGGELTPTVPGPRRFSEDETQQPRSSLDRDSGRRSGYGPPVLVADVVLEPERTIAGRIVDEHGEPIEGASVEALGHYAVRPGMAFPDRASTLAGRDGRFAIEGLRPDVSYQLECASAGRGTRLVLVPPARTPVDDRGTIALPAEVALRGRVLDAMDRPVEGVVVRATADAPADTSAEAEDRDLWPRDPAYVAPIELVTRTERSGELDLTGLAPGRYRLTVECDGVTWVEKALDLHAGSGTTTVEMRLPPEAPMLRGHVLHGGSPARGLRVIARDGGFHRTVTSDASGAFRLGGLAPDTTYEVGASTWRPGAATWLEDEVEVRIGSAASIELELERRRAEKH